MFFELAASTSNFGRTAKNRTCLRPKARRPTCEDLWRQPGLSGVHCLPGRVCAERIRCLVHLPLFGELALERWLWMGGGGGGGGTLHEVIPQLQKLLLLIIIIVIMMSFFILAIYYLLQVEASFENKNKSTSKRKYTEKKADKFKTHWITLGIKWFCMFICYTINCKDMMKCIVQ